MTIYHLSPSDPSFLRSHSYPPPTESRNLPTDPTTKIPQIPSLRLEFHHPLSVPPHVSRNSPLQTPPILPEATIKTTPTSIIPSTDRLPIVHHGHQRHFSLNPHPNAPCTHQPLTHALSRQWSFRCRSGKESACQCRRCKRHWLDPWVAKIPQRRKWQRAPENSMDRGAWRATIQGVAKNRTRLSDGAPARERARAHTHTHTHTQSQEIQLHLLPFSGFPPCPCGISQAPTPYAHAQQWLLCGNLPVFNMALS